MRSVLSIFVIFLFFGCSDESKKVEKPKENPKSSIEVAVNFSNPTLEALLEEVSSNRVVLKQSSEAKIKIDKNIDLSNFSFNEKMAWFYYGGGDKELQRDGFYTFLGIEEVKSDKLDKNLGSRDFLFLVDRAFFDSLPKEIQEMIKVAFAINYDKEYFKIKKDLIATPIDITNKRGIDRDYLKIARDWSLLSEYSYFKNLSN